jgi:hypothetical protein
MSKLVAVRLPDDIVAKMGDAYVSEAIIQALRHYLETFATLDRAEILRGDLSKAHRPPVPAKKLIFDGPTLRAIPCDPRPPHAPTCGCALCRS